MAENGNGSARATWAAASICSGVVLALCSAFGTAYAREQDRHELEIRTLREQSLTDSRDAGKINQQLIQLTERAQRNQDRIEDAFRELDDKLQRETTLKTDRVASQIGELDTRLQAEMSTLVNAVRDRVSALEAWKTDTAANRWTKLDQERFEDQLGVKRRATP